MVIGGKTALLRKTLRLNVERTSRAQMAKATAEGIRIAGKVIEKYKADQK